MAAVQRAVALLDVLAQGAELGTNELARRTGLSASTVSRTLATLAAGELVEHVPGSGRYRLGVRLMQLGHAALARLDLRALARPHLSELVESTGETATISVPGGPDAVTVEFVQSPCSVQSVAQLGRPSIAHATAAGKVVLAWGGVSLPPTPLRPFTPRTITDPRALSREVARVRRRGWARAVREREEDLSALATPVFGASGELVAVLGLQGPSSRFDRDAMQAALTELLDRAAALSHALGWNLTDEEGA